ncbi:metallophosphoesterase [Larkinella sp. C7]|uniref:metallophosphoesterase n=1 Tax=Larkinella sp. C7 TaxID=2576607 RepID=UPI0011114A96|nr:metallophosphoesterase [Larkinella sp. C7]
MLWLGVDDTNPFVQVYRQAQATYPDILQDTGRQLQWIDNVLARSTEIWKLVVSHHPLYSVGKDHGDQDELVQLGPLFQKFGSQMNLSGHAHTLQHLPPVGPTYLVISGGGGAFSGPYC